MGSQQPPRAIAPKPGDTVFRTDTSFHTRLQRASSACIECRKRKQRCDGASPCYICRRSGQDCVIDEESDGRRKIALKRKIDSLEQDNEMLRGLIQTIREVDEESALEYFRLIRSNLALEDVRQHFNANIVADSAGGEALTCMEVAHAERQTAGSKSYIGKTMNVIRAPAQSMDPVSDDIGSIAHHISLYPICLDDIETDSRRRISLSCKLKALKIIVTDILEALGNKKMSQRLVAAMRIKAFLEHVQHLLPRDSNNEETIRDCIEPRKLSA
ncbi:hypothetical protein ASPCAL15071 [Aspergillus calidoustus]|uniref:Zn(2)-C6 fungal-type domain-containing protein n=1 Tax=Aspergillus calidoustus TaxID=454130 RepID=A0A0U5CKQ9_ASPCI|nr:hypothetical protein ASPCAL15071 [Aspergillus calidoustus]